MHATHIAHIFWNEVLFLTLLFLLCKNINPTVILRDWRRIPARAQHPWHWWSASISVRDRIHSSMVPILLSREIARRERESGRSRLWRPEKAIGGRGLGNSCCTPCIRNSTTPYPCTERYSPHPSGLRLSIWTRRIRTNHVCWLLLRPTEHINLWRTKRIRKISTIKRLQI